MNTLTPTPTPTPPLPPCPSLPPSQTSSGVPFLILASRISRVRPAVMLCHTTHRPGVKVGQTSRDTPPPPPLPPPHIPSKHTHYRCSDETQRQKEGKGHEPQSAARRKSKGAKSVFTASLWFLLLALETTCPPPHSPPSVHPWERGQYLHPPPVPDSHAKVTLNEPRDSRVCPSIFPHKSPQRWAELLHFLPLLLFSFIIAATFFFRL